MNIYFVCAWYEVGMRHYSFSVLKNLSKYPSPKFKIYVTLVLRNSVENYPELKELSHLNIDYIIIKNNYVNILSKIFPVFFDRYIQFKVRKYDAKILYILFEGFFFKNIESIKRTCKVIYTIHDLIPHEKYKTNFKERWLSKVENMRAKYLLDSSDYILTNFYDQYQRLKNSNKNNAFFVSMPTLINNNILNGVLKPRELNTKDYILFFGRIDKYKGLDKLIQCHLNSNTSQKLVIAGAGNLWFEIPKTDKVVLINRHIEDEEIKYLFENASCSVLPYISVTQTGIVSIPFKFGCPVILSKINIFMLLAENSGSLVCDFDSAIEYKGCIAKLSDIKLKKNIIETQNEYYVKHYDSENFARNLTTIFEGIQNEIEQ